MTLARQVAHNTALQLAGKVMSTLLGLATVAIMTRSLGVEQFGWYITATGFLQFIGIFSDFGFTVTTSNLLAEPNYSARDVMDTAFTWRLITALVFNGAVPATIIFFPYPPEVKLAVALTTGSFLATALSSIFIAYYRTKLRLWYPTVADLVSRLVLLVGVYMVAVGHAGFLPMMAIITLAALISFAYLLYKSGGIRLRLTRAVTRALFYKMWPTALAIIFNSFYLQGDRVILPLYVSQTDVGFYGAAYRVLDVVVQSAAMIMGLIMPLITFAWSRGLTADFRHRLQLGFDIIAFFLLPTLAGATVLAGPLMRFVAGPEFAAAGWILGYLSVAIIGICFGMVFGHVMLAINHQKESLWVFLSDAILSVIGYFIFIPRFGVAGAIGVTIFSEWYAGFFLALLSWYYSKQFPALVTFAKIALASAGMAFIVRLLQPLNFLVSVGLGALIYMVAILLLRVISKQTIREIVAFRSVAPSAEF